MTINFKLSRYVAKAKQGSALASQGEVMVGHFQVWERFLGAAETPTSVHCSPDQLCLSHGQPTTGHHEWESCKTGPPHLLRRLPIFIGHTLTPKDCSVSYNRGHQMSRNTKENGDWKEFWEFHLCSSSEAVTVQKLSAKSWGAGLDLLHITVRTRWQTRSKLTKDGQT